MTEELYRLVMPFVTVVSEGGPHPDHAYVAGFQMGVLDVTLMDKTLTTCSVSVYRCQLEQVDLIAMRHGFTMMWEPMDDTWAQVTFTKG